MKRVSKTLMLCCLALAVLCSGALMACKDIKPSAPPAPENTTLALSHTTAELDLYEEVQLSVTEAGFGAVTWSSSDNAVATVKDGLVKSVAAGVAIITATRGEKSGYCTVTVINSFTAPIISFDETEFVADKGDQTHVTVSVRYKGNAVDYAGEIEWDLTEVYKFEAVDSDIATFDLDDDKKGATLTVGAYGEAILTASAVVWGFPVSGALNLRAINKNVEITSALQKNGENYAVALNPIGVTYKNKRVSENSVDPQITVKQNGVEVPGAAVTWLPSVKNVAAFDGTAGKITATEDGALDTDTLVGVYNGNCVKIDVSVERAEIEFEDDDKWIMELKNIPAENGEFPVQLSDLNKSLPNGDIAGAIEKVEIPYKLIDANNVITNTKTDILKSFDAATQTVTLTPPVRAYNMGDMTATVTTSKAIYTIPTGIYTLVISDAAELDEFGSYTTYQWVDPYIWDGYFVLDNDITYNKQLTEQSINDNTRVFQPFIYTHTVKDDEKYFDKDAKVKFNDWNNGFFGVFDGRGHVIDGFMVDASARERVEGAAEYGGFIGKLGAASTGDTLRRGTIKNLVFTNAVHGAKWYKVADETWKVKGSWGAFLFSSSIGGAVQNVYMQVDSVGSHGIFTERPWMTQVTALDNIVLDIMSEATNTYCPQYALGNISNWADDTYQHFRNVYTVRITDRNSLNVSGGSIVHKDNAPEQSFATKMALGEYLADKNLYVTEANGWDMDFWTFDAYGAPIPKKLAEYNDGVTSVNMSTVGVNTFDGVKPSVYVWKPSSDSPLTFNSSDDAVVTVSPEGLVAARGAGTATVTATPAQGAAKTLTVTVTDAYEGAKGFTDHVAIASVGDINRLAAVTDTTGKKYVLACDIDLNGRVGSIAHDFKGTFNGNGFALKNGKLMVMPMGNDDNQKSEYNKKQEVFSGKPNGATIRNLQLTGWEIVENTAQGLTANGSEWWYVGVINNPSWCTLENLYVDLTVSADGSNSPYDAPFGQPSNSTFRNVLVNITYTQKYSNYASLFTGTWAGNVTVENVYAIVHAPDGVTISGDDADIKDTLGNNEDANNHMPTSADRNYASLDALKTAHADAFAAGGAFTGTFWDGILQA